jgi:hypothetical protein
VDVLLCSAVFESSLVIRESQKEFWFAVGASASSCSVEAAESPRRHWKITFHPAGD